MYAHASVGVIHVRPILDLRHTADIERFKHISEETFRTGERIRRLLERRTRRRLLGAASTSGVILAIRYTKPSAKSNSCSTPKPHEPRQDHRRPAHRSEPALRAAYRDNPVETVFQFREDGSFENAAYVHRGGRMPQDAGRHDVPQLQSHPRRGTLHRAA